MHSILPYKNPLIIEINALVWLQELSNRFQQAITLNNVPASEWDQFALQGFDYVWLMGVWQRSPVGLRIALQHPGIVGDCQDALPGLAPTDMVGSPFCIKDYQVDEMLGGHQGLIRARHELKSRGIRMMLDFVPGHVAPDHPWTATHPEYFIQGTEEELETQAGNFMDSGGTVFARARDPFYPPWPDVLQLNAFSSALRQEFISLLQGLAALSDGVRCDMAMLVTNRIFTQTWGERAGKPPAEDFWELVIPAVKRDHPEFLFMAEVYWDMEWELQQQGFDYCYDKRLYDRLLDAEAYAVRQHLQADLAFQKKLVRFIENHDEQRIASKLDDRRNMAAAVSCYTLPGARLFHLGQREGRKTRIPVFLGRSPQEQSNEPLSAFYDQLLRICSQPLLQDGNWLLCSVEGWPGNYCSHHLLAWSWSLDHQRALIVVNYSDKPAQGMVKWPWNEDPEHEVNLGDPVHDVEYTRSGYDLNEYGLYVDLSAWDFHLFIF